jgi:hypothetical protein
MEQLEIGKELGKIPSLSPDEEERFGRDLDLVIQMGMNESISHVGYIVGGIAAFVGLAQVFPLYRIGFLVPLVVFLLWQFGRLQFWTSVSSFAATLRLSSFHEGTSELARLVIVRSGIGPFRLICGEITSGVVHGGWKKETRAGSRFWKPSWARRAVTIWGLILPQYLRQNKLNISQIATDKYPYLSSVFLAG